MLINAEEKTVRAVFAATVNGEKTCLSVVRRDAVGFERDSGGFRPAAARYAAALAMSASDEALLRQNLTALGYEDTVLYGYDGADSHAVGTAIGTRRLGGATLVAVILRPTVGSEWYSNFEIGYGAAHSGFRKAASYAEQRVYDYLFERGLRRARFFLTGYSRGGAAANLLAKRLSDRFGIDAVQCYTFASPNTCVTAYPARFGNIFNLVRDQDLFTRLPLTGWGYTKYGYTVALSGGMDFRERFFALTGEEYIGFGDSSAVDGFLYAAIRLAPCVRAYCERRYPVGGRMLSLYDYMTAVARLLANEQEDSTDILLDAAASDFAPLSDVLTAGFDIGALLSPAQGIPRCSVADSHSPAAYMAAPELYSAGA